MIRDEREGTVVLRFASLPVGHVEALVSTRLGGVSEGSFRGLNTGFRVGDLAPAVLENRRRLFSAHGLPLASSVWCKQVHQDTVQVIRAADLEPWDDVDERGRATLRHDRGGFDERHIVEATDALVTDLPGVPLCVTLADCVPVAIYDPRRQAIGLAHAGWGGTVSRISSATVATMVQEYGSEPGDMLAGIGPSISPDRYEVGGPVISRAREAYGADADRILRPIAGADDKALFDLWEANAIDLESAGVPRANIEVSGISTIDDLDTFYSYRAEAVQGEHDTGRLAGVLMLRDSVDM